MNKIFFWKGFISGAIIFILLSIFLYNKFLVPSNLSLTTIETKDLKENKVELIKFRGKPIVINYWATWCAPCVKEFPHFEKIKQQFGEDIHFIMISDESIQKIKLFSDSNPYTFNYLKSTKKLSEYGIHLRPTTFFYDSKGNLIIKHVNSLNSKQLKTLITNIME